MKGCSQPYFALKLWASVLLWTSTDSSAPPQTLYFQDPALVPGGPCISNVRVDNIGVTLSFTSTDPEVDAAIYHVVHNADDYEICIDGNGAANDFINSPASGHAILSLSGSEPDCRPLLQVHSPNSWRVTISPSLSSSPNSTLLSTADPTNTTEVTLKTVSKKKTGSNFCAVETWLRLRPPPLPQSTVSDDKTLSPDAKGPSSAVADKHKVLGYHAVYLWDDTASAISEMERLWIARGCAQPVADLTSAEPTTETSYSASSIPLSLKCEAIKTHLEIARGQILLEDSQISSALSMAESDGELTGKFGSTTTSATPRKQSMPKQIEDDTDIITIIEPSEGAERFIDCDVGSVWGGLDGVGASSGLQRSRGNVWDDSDLCRLTARHKGGSASLPMLVDIDALAKGSNRHGPRASSNGLAAVLRANPLSFSLCYGVVSPAPLWKNLHHSNDRRRNNSNCNSIEGSCTGSNRDKNNQTTIALAAVALSITSGTAVPTVRPPQCLSLGDPVLQGPLPKVKVPFVLQTSQFFQAARAKAVGNEDLSPSFRGTVVLASWLQRSASHVSHDESNSGGRECKDDNQGTKSEDTDLERITQTKNGVIGISAVTFHLTLKLRSVRPDFFPLPPLVPIHDMAPLPSKRAGRSLFSVVVQGPLNAVSLNAVPGYLAVAKRVVVSCWDDADVVRLLEPLVQIVGPPKNLSTAAEVLHDPDPNAKHVQSDWVFLSQPLPVPYATLPIWELTTFYQFTSTLAALRYITTPFVAKTRSDEAFSDLGPLLAAAVANPQALISSNIYLRVAAQQPALVVPTSTGANAKSSRSTSDTGDSSNSSNSNDDRAAMSLVSDHLFAGATTNIWAVSSLLVAAFDTSLDVPVTTKAREIAAATAWVRCEAAQARNREFSAADTMEVNVYTAGSNYSAANDCAEAYPTEPFFPGPGPHSSEKLLFRGFLDSSGYALMKHQPASTEKSNDAASYCPFDGGCGFSAREVSAILNSQAVHIVPVSALTGAHTFSVSQGSTAGVQDDHSSSDDFRYRVACNQFGRNGAGMQASVGPDDVGRAEHALLLAYPSHSAYAAALRNLIPADPTIEKNSRGSPHQANTSAYRWAVDAFVAAASVAAEIAAPKAAPPVRDFVESPSHSDTIGADAFHDAFFETLLSSTLDYQIEVFRAWFGADTIGSYAAIKPAGLTPFLAPLAARIAVGFLGRFLEESEAESGTDHSTNFSEALHYAELSRVGNHDYLTPDEAHALGI